MKNILAYISLVLLFIGCDIHEFPTIIEKDNTIPVSVSLNFDTTLQLHNEMTYASGRIISTKFDTEAHDIRYIVKVYSADSRSKSGEEFQTFVFTKSDVSDVSNTLTLRLDEGDYIFRVWVDYVDPGSQEDKYYITSDFSEIILANRDPHIGSTPFRDAFYGSAAITVAKDSENQADIDMERPMGKFRFISTDHDIFMQTMADKGISADLNDFTVVFNYNLFMPCSFNAIEDMTADSWQGVTFTSKMTMTEDNELKLGSDYIFVNTRGTTLSVSTAVYDKNGILVASSSAIDVPIIRNGLTVVQGDFLTSKSSGGISVSTEYEGNFNIEIK